jgi:hypothetical protein
MAEEDISSRWMGSKEKIDIKEGSISFSALRATNAI